MERSLLTTEELKQRLKKRFILGHLKPGQLYHNLEKMGIDYVTLQETFPNVRIFSFEPRKDYVIVYMKNGFSMIPIVDDYFFDIRADIDAMGPLDEKAYERISDGYEEVKKKYEWNKQAKERFERTFDFLKMEKKSRMKKELFLYQMRMGKEADKIVNAHDFQQLLDGYLVRLKEGVFMGRGEKIKILDKKTKSELKNNGERLKKDYERYREWFEKISFIKEKNKLRILFTERK